MSSMIDDCWPSEGTMATLVFVIVLQLEGVAGASMYQYQHELLKYNG